MHAAGGGLVCVTKAHRWLAELPRFSVVMKPACSVFENASPARQTGTGGEGMLEAGHRPHAAHHWRPLTLRRRG